MQIRNTTFHDVLTAVMGTDPPQLQPNVFVWSEGECFVQWQGAGSKWHQQVRKKADPFW